MELEGSVHVSSGGVVYQSEAGSLSVLLLYRITTCTWHLPKGTVEQGESLSEAAVREVREETGAHSRVVGYLGNQDSVYQRFGNNVQKKTHYFLLEFVEGDLCPEEHDLVVWVSLPLARKLLINHPPGSEAESDVLSLAMEVLRRDS